MKNIKAALREQGVRAIFVLMGGTSFAQLLGVLALPVLTRIYAPEDFNVLAIFSSIVVVTSIAACLRFDVAIALPDSEKEAIGLFSLSILFCLLTSIATAIVIGVLHFFPAPGQAFFALSHDLWMIPLAVFSLGTFSALQYLATRRKQFVGVARARIAQSLACVAIQLLLGIWLLLDMSGLVVGYLIGGFFGIAGLFRTVMPEGRAFFSGMSVAYLRSLFVQYQQFPRYSVLESVANSAGIQVSIVVIAALAVGPEAGYLMLAMRVLGIPMSLLGAAVGQVYLSEAPEVYRQGNLATYTERLIERLLKVGVGPLVFLSIVAPTAFPYIFGLGWARAGELVLWMMPWFVFQFLASPVSMVMHIRERQRTMLLLTLGGLVIRLGSVLLAAWIGVRPISEIYAVSSAIFYILCLWIFLRTAHVRLGQMIALAARGAFIPVAWALLGMTLVYL